MESLVSNGWAQLCIFTGTGVLCLAMSVWLGARHLRLHKALPRRPIVLSLYDSEPHSPALHVSSVVQHGRIVEIKGTTDAGAVVMINGQPVASIFPEHAFRHFLGPLRAGTTIVSITCQDEHGGVNTQSLAVTLE